jgi:hypothetical protein
VSLSKERDKIKVNKSESSEKLKKREIPQQNSGFDT